MSLRTKRTEEQILSDRLQAWVQAHWDDLTWQDAELFEDVQRTILTAGHDVCDDERDALQDEIRDLEDELDKVNAKLDKARPAAGAGEADT